MEPQQSERIITPMSKSLVEAIDNFRFAMRIPSRAETIRRLIEEGLAAYHAAAPPPGAAPPLGGGKEDR